MYNSLNLKLNAFEKIQGKLVNLIIGLLEGYSIRSLHRLIGKWNLHVGWKPLFSSDDSIMAAMKLCLTGSSYSSMKKYKQRSGVGTGVKTSPHNMHSTPTKFN
jgi:hypothetical protein